MHDGWCLYDDIFNFGSLVTAEGVPVSSNGEQEDWRNNIRNEMITFADGPAVSAVVNNVIEEPEEEEISAISVIVNLLFYDALKAGALFAVAKLVMLIIELI